VGGVAHYKIPRLQLITKKTGVIMEKKTNSQLAKEMGVTSRQISKSRRRGWIWKNGAVVKYTAPAKKVK